MIELKLMELQSKAAHNPEMRRALLDTRSAADPVRAFCDKCADYGYDISVYELLTAGEEFCAAMLRSVNGGGVEAPDGWDDFYEMFMRALEEAEMKDGGQL